MSIRIPLFTVSMKSKYGTLIEASGTRIQGEREVGALAPIHLRQETAHCHTNFDRSIDSRSLVVFLATAIEAGGRCPGGAESFSEQKGSYPASNSSPDGTALHRLTPRTWRALFDCCSFKAFWCRWYDAALLMDPLKRSLRKLQRNSGS